MIIDDNSLKCDECGRETNTKDLESSCWITLIVQEGGKIEIYKRGKLLKTVERVDVCDCACLVNYLRIGIKYLWEES